jgi:hypothetical protein
VAVALWLIAAVAMPTCSYPRSQRIVRRLATTRGFRRSSQPSSSGPRASVHGASTTPDGPTRTDVRQHAIATSRCCRRTKCALSPGWSARRVVTWSAGVFEISAIRG